MVFLRGHVHSIICVEFYCRNLVHQWLWVEETTWFPRQLSQRVVCTLSKHLEEPFVDILLGFWTVFSREYVVIGVCRIENQWMLISDVFRNISLLIEVIKDQLTTLFTHLLHLP